uniref:ADP-ribosyl cyclase/cyclic ADP-ribose hydrolase n=1 Tax=Fagus sylvatica TaxID=28930 RepID=A0A2N9HBW6_FAGSY
MAVDPHLVGIDSRVEEIMKLFGELDDVRSIGIWGMAGIETAHEKNGLVCLQQKLLSDILNEKEVNIQDYLLGIQAIRKSVLKKKLLIIIDDVDDSNQLKALAIPSRRDWFGHHDCFGPGSRIIITSRDKQLLARHCLIYPAMGLDNDEALELFSWKAFEKPCPEEDYLELSKAFVEYAKGLPLALAVLGSSLFGEDKDRLADILEVDYDYKNGIDTLQKKSLIIILGRKVLMHDLLQEMGWEIVRCEPQRGRRTRLLQELELFVCNHNWKQSVEGIKLSLPPHEKEELKPKTFSMMTRLRLLIIHNVHLPGGLSYLSNELRLLQWNEYPLKSMPESFQPKKLVELIMHHSIISQHYRRQLSNLQELKLIDLSYSQYLKETPNFIGFSKLERLIFQGCISLCELHPSVGALKRLTLLNLKECKRLNCLPPEINLESLENFILSGCSKLKKFSEIGTNMTRLSELYLDGTAVEEMPLSIKHLTSLTLLSLQDCKNLSSFPGVNLPSLKTLNLSGCKVQTPKSLLLQGLSLIRAPYDFLKDYFFPIQVAVNLLLPRFRFIVSLNLTDHNLWDGALPDDLSCLSSLQYLDLSRNNFTHLPDSISQLSKLKRLKLNDCSRLQSLPVLPLRFTIVNSYCGDDASCRLPSSPYEDREPFIESHMEDAIHQNDIVCVFSNSTEIPEWFSHQSPGSSVTIPLPSDLRDNSSWEGIALFVVVVIHKNLNNISSGQDYEVCIDFICRSGMVVEAGKLRDHLEECGNCIGASITSNHPYLEIKMCAARILYRQNLVEFLQAHGQIDKNPNASLLLRLEECRNIGASFEYKNPGVQFIECGIRLVYEEDVEEFVQTLVQCMLRSSVAYHEFFYQNLSHQVEEMVAGFDNRKDVGCSSSLQRIPFSPSFTGLLIPARKGQHASIMSSESLIKACLQKNFEEGEIFNCCFAEREIPRWFGSQSNMDSMKAYLSADNCDNDPDWMGCALCGLFEFHRHPTVVRMNLGSEVEVFQFRCLLRTNSCHRRLVCYGLLTGDNKLVTLNQRAFIWVLFIPRMKLAHLWSQSTRDVAFWFESSIPDLSVEKIGIKPKPEKHKPEKHGRVHAYDGTMPAPFDSFLHSCDQEVFYQIWDDYPEVFNGTKSSYEDLHPQRLFISQEEASGTSHYSYEEDPFPHHHFRYFHPSTPYNSSFPTRRTPLWFNHHSRGHSVTIDIPPNLYDDCNWLGLTLYASFLIPWDRENSVSSINSSHFLYCRFQTSNAGLDDQILVCRTTDEENEWLLGRYGLIWISYIPGEAFKDMLHQGGCIEASFVSNWPGVTVLKCGLRLLYQHDQVQFEQELKHCNAFISARRDFSRRPTRFEKFEAFYQVIKNPETILREKDRLDFDGCSKYSSCSPPVEILHWFKHNSNEPSVTIDISTNLYNDGEWKGLALCAYFSIDDHQPFENPSSTISHHLVCHLETDVVGQKLVLHEHRTANEEFTWLDTDGGFLWLSYIPRQSFPDQFNQYSYIKASIITDWPGVIVKKCGFSFYNSFDRGFVYNSCFPPIEIPHWFEVRRDKPEVRFRLSRKWYNRDTRMGLALCALFEVNKYVTDVDYIVNSKNSYSLICHLENKIGSVKPRHIYWPTQQHLMLSHLGGFIWLSYIPHGSFPDWLYDCDYVTVSFTTNCLGLTAQKCGLRPLYQHDDEEVFKKIINHCENSVPDVLRRINQMKIKNRERKTRSWIENELRKIDPHPMRWCSQRSDVPWVTIPLPPNLYNDSTWMGLVLCTSFAVDVNKITNILNLEIPFVLNCKLQTHGSVEPVRARLLTKENIRKLQLGGFIWLFYIGRGSFQTSLDSWIKASFLTDCQGLKVQKCGLRLLYRNDVEEFKQTIGNWMKQMHDDEETSSRTSSSSEDSHLEILRGPIDSMLKDKGKRVQE